MPPSVFFLRFLSPLSREQHVGYSSWGPTSSHQGIAGGVDALVK